MTILIPVLVLLGVGLLCAVLLTLAATFFGVEEDAKATAIRDCLPGANCGACGYSGCDGYAKALANQETEIHNHEYNFVVPECQGWVDLVSTWIENL